MVVYQLYCKANQKSYIGITDNLKRRMAVHKNNTSSTVLNRTISKYGWDNFVLTIIDKCSSWEDACKKERGYIKRYNTRAPNGLNMTDGGEGVFGLNHSEKTKKQMSDSHKGKGLGADNPMYGKTGSRKGKKHSKESILKMSEAKLGKEAWNKGKACPQLSSENNGFFGKTHSEEVKEHLSNMAIGRKHSSETRNKISIASKQRVGELSNQAKLNNQIVVNIRNEYEYSTITQKELAKRYNVTQSMIHCIIARKSWVHI